MTSEEHSGHSIIPTYGGGGLRVNGFWCEDCDRDVTLIVKEQQARAEQAMERAILRQPRYPQPDPAPVLEAAKRNRANWLAAMAAVSRDGLTEHQREAKQEIIDNLDEEAYDSNNG